MTTYQPEVIAWRFVPRRRTATAALIVGFALFTALTAQFEFHIPGTPVPITGQTLAVLLSGAALGSRAGSASMALYVALGAIGLPFYAGGEGGWTHATGATAGYLVGFVVAAGLVGFLAERRQDRNVVTAAVAFLAGSAVIYGFGVSWLAYDLELSVEAAIGAGMAPFVVGDLIKVGVAGLLLPTAWKLTGSR